LVWLRLPLPAGLEYDETGRIRVTPAPERGRATEAALRLLAETLSVPRRSVSLVSGHASRDKLVSVAGLTSTEVEHRLASETAEGRRPSR